MRPAVIISCFLINVILPTGQLALIETEETVWAAVGDQACLSCQLSEDKDFLRITWQKVCHDEQKSLASYTKEYGYRVRPDLRDKMDFQCEDVKSCSMVIRKVMEEDEGCYLCLFNTYPGGALIGRTCIRLYELHEPVLDVSRSNVSVLMITIPGVKGTSDDAWCIISGSMVCIVAFLTISWFTKRAEKRGIKIAPGKALEDALETAGKDPVKTPSADSLDRLFEDTLIPLHEDTWSKPF